MLPRRARLFTVLALVSVGTVSAAGVWTIVTSRRQAAEEATRRFAWDTQGRGRALERLLTATRADLSFLAGSPPISRLLASADGSPAGSRARRRKPRSSSSCAPTRR